MPFIDQSPFPGFAHNKHPTFHGSQMAEKKTGKRQQTKLIRSDAKQKSKFWPVHMAGIKTLLNFVCNPPKSSPLAKKKAF